MRNPFKRARRTPDAPAAASTAQLIQSVSEELGSLRAELSSIRMEWAEVLDKINRWSAREAARRRRDVNASLSADLEPVGVEMAPNGDRSAQGHADAKNELRRRAFRQQ